MKAVTIDFVSDVVCPWCAIALNTLEQALAAYPEIEATLNFQPFELNPDMAAEGEEAVEHLRRKYGAGTQQILDSQQQIIARGEAVGFGFDFAKRTHVYNTFDAHRLLHWAATLGQARPLKHALFKAYFSQGRAINDREVLATIAGEAGLSREAARAELASARHGDAVRAQERYYQEAGIHAVPAVIFNQQHLVSGAQPLPAFEQVLRQIAAQG
ncbi:DsbA family oxidoreductase [Paludibacterium sp.]|uniref:DsbA family oxidoreductase n=1 Tax=Paludibacterium sp. TaxID=1917523 RepID=UPI0025ED6575|nr:DsbA family oxidoreductase [Paludibacterium sp.]MBV8647020.1 DsbA family oxidoreductase [Paludibacterium sp.]